MIGWITKDASGYRKLHVEDPNDGNPHVWASPASTHIHKGRASAFMALVPDAEWDSIGPGECKRLTLPEAFDPDGPVEVGDYVETHGWRCRVDRKQRNGLCSLRDLVSSTIVQIPDAELTILAKAPKPAPEPEPVKCRHCGAAPYVQTPHTIGATRYDWWQRYCVGCGQRGPKRPTEPEANEVWNVQNT